LDHRSRGSAALLQSDCLEPEPDTRGRQSSGRIPGFQGPAVRAGRHRDDPFGVEQERVELDYVSGQPQAPPNRLSHRLCCLGKSIYSFRANEMFGRGDGVEPSDPDDAGKHIEKVPFLIRARSVVQVHPGPPFKSPVNTRRFSLFPFPRTSLSKKTLCQPLSTSRTAKHLVHRSPATMYCGCVLLPTGMRPNSLEPARVEGLLQ
jgi:hypothetical protein